MASVLSNAQVLDRAERSSRGLQFVALAPDLKPIEHLSKTSAPAVAGTSGAVGAVVIRPPAFTIEFGARHASEVRHRQGSDALGVRAPDGESAFVFSGQAPQIVREGARLVDRVVLPGMQLPDGRAWEAIGCDLLARLRDPRAEALPKLPCWLRQWLRGEPLPSDQPEPEVTPEPAPSCATCHHHDSPSGECRRGAPTLVIGPSGAVPGWLVVAPGDLCSGFTPRVAPPPACRGCRWFALTPGTDGRRGLCRGSPPLLPVDNTGRPVGRAGQWPSVPATAWCGSHEPAAQVRGEAA